MSQDLSTPAVVPAGEPHSAVSWAAIFAGATASLAIALALTTLVAGFGLRLVSPWPGRVTPSNGFTPLLGAGMITVQVISSALGGYIAGRMRTKWLNLHSHEAHFRDTAHGLLTWAVSSLVGAVLVATVFFVPTDPAALQNVDMAVADPATIAAVAHRAAQVSFFLGFGLLLSAFSAAVSAAIGGLRRDEMYARYWVEEHRPAQAVRG